VPVHGEIRHMMAHARLARSLQVPEAVVIGNGQMLRLAPGRAEIIDETPSGRVYLDGRVLVDESHDHMRERRAMSFAGVISVTLALDAKDHVAGEPAILLEGIPDAIHTAVQAAVDETVRRYNPKKQGEEQFLENVRRAARRAAHDAWGKKPVTRVQIIRV
jgi:ribonuclease J